MRIRNLFATGVVFTAAFVFASADDGTVPTGQWLGMGLLAVATALVGWMTLAEFIDKYQRK
jgi:hypothetical protein